MFDEIFSLIFSIRASINYYNQSNSHITDDVLLVIFILSTSFLNYPELSIY